MAKEIRHLTCEGECKCSTEHRIEYLGHHIKENKKYAMFWATCIGCVRDHIHRHIPLKGLKKVRTIPYQDWIDLLSEKVV